MEISKISQNSGRSKLPKFPRSKLAKLADSGVADLANSPAAINYSIHITI